MSQVKPLEWHGPDYEDEYWAASIIGRYTIQAPTGNGRWLGGVGGYFQDIEAAKAAAQADFDVRILSALTPAGSGEVVAWQARHLSLNGGKWIDASRYTAEQRAVHIREEGWEYRPLYTHLAPSNVSVAVTGDWQALETAPEDGTPVWGITMEAQNPSPRVMWFQGGRWLRVARGEKFASSGPHAWWPTHWQPILTPSSGNQS